MSAIIMTSPWKNTDVCGNCGHVNDYFFDAPPELCDFLTGAPLHRNDPWCHHDPCPNCGKKSGREKVVRVIYVMNEGKRKWIFWREKNIGRYFEEMSKDGPRVLPQGPYKETP